MVNFAVTIQHTAVKIKWGLMVALNFASILQLPTAEPAPPAVARARTHGRRAGAGRVIIGIVARAGYYRDIRHGLS